MLRFKALIAICSFFTVAIINQFSSSDKNVELFNEIIRSTNSSIEEIDVRASFTSDNFEKDNAYELIKRLMVENISDIKETSGDEYFTMDFTGTEISGYIENIRENKSNTITIDMKSRGNKDIPYLKNKIREAVGGKNTNIKYYEYIKAYTRNNKLSELNKQIAELLRKRGAVNIDTVNISNGYSTVAYTKMYEPIKNNGKLMDINYAVTEYSSGTYIIIGTPLITVPY